MRRTISMAILLACLLAPGAAAAATQRATHGDVTATLTSHGRYPYTDLRLAISLSGAVVYDQPVYVKNCSPECSPASPHHALHVLRLTASGRTDVVLELYSGGAHCCYFDQVFAPTRTRGVYRITTRDFGDPGAALRDLGRNGLSEFVSANDAFAYLFGNDFAESGLPLQILAFTSDSTFIDVTRHYPALIRRDAAIWWKAFLSDHAPGRFGLLAAWVADEYNLGQRAAANRTLDRQVRLHRIKPGFVPRLKAFLKRQGYAR